MRPAPRPRSRIELGNSIGEQKANIKIHRASLLANDKFSIGVAQLGDLSA
jgi:hypothetical protein